MLCGIGECSPYCCAEEVDIAVSKEREKVLKAVIDCGWNCEVHSDKALYEMVEKQLKEGEKDDR